MTPSRRRCVLRQLAYLAVLQFVACARQERALEAPGPSARSEAISDAGRALKAEAGTTIEVAPAPTLQHDQLPLAAQGGLLHRFRIPLAQASFRFVDLAYERPLIDALDEAALLFNGGYWAYDGERRVIQGLVIVNDLRHAAKSAAKGGVMEVRAGQARMIASSSYQPQPGTVLALQCSPRLVSEGQVVDKLDGQRRAARTALCVGSDTGTLDVYLTAPGTTPTLRELAEFLRVQGCLQALNLDGGPSTAAVARESAGVFRLGHGLALPYGLAVQLTAGAQR